MTEEQFDVLKQIRNALRFLVETSDMYKYRTVPRESGIPYERQDEFVKREVDKIMRGEEE